MANQTDIAAALNRVLQQQQQGAPETAEPTAVPGLAPSTDVLTGAAPAPSPFSDALDRVLRGGTQATPAAPAAPGVPAAPAVPRMPDSLGARAAREAASAVSAANNMLNDGVRPDVAAEIRRLSRDEGVPIPQAAQTYVERIRSARGRQYGRLLIENPGLRRIATQGSAYADFMDDAAALATTETAFNALRSFGAAFPRAGADLLNLPVTAGDIIERQTDRLILDPLVEADLPVLSALADYLRADLPEGVVSTREFIFGRPSKVLSDVSEYVGPPPDERNVVTDAAGALGQLGATALAYVIGGGPLALLLGGAQTTEEQRRRVEEAGQLGTLQGDIGIIGAAGVSTIIERLNLGLIFERIPENMRNRLVRALATATTEGATEALQAMSSNLVAKGVYDPDTGVVDDVAYEGLLGGFAGLVLGALTPGRVRPSDVTDRLPQEAVDVLSADTLQSAADQATAAQQALETTRAAIEETATFARDPEAVRELLEAAGDQEISIPVQEIERLYQEGALTDDDIAYLQVEDELTQQGELSGDVSTTASRVLTLQGDAFARLSEHVRTQPSAPTTAEAREALANREADIERLQGVLEQAQAAADEVGVLSERIAAEVRAAAPQYTAAQGRAMGRLLAERYAARAALFEPGTTAQSLYERDRVAFEAAGQPAAPGVEQAAASVGMRTPEFQTWFADSKVVDAAGQPLVVYHGTASAFEAFDPGRTGQGDPGFLGSGFYFGDNKSIARSYAMMRPGTDERVIEAHLSLQNPFVWGPKGLGVRGFVQEGDRLPDAIHDEVVRRSGYGTERIPSSEYEAAERTVSRVVREVLEERGYDGVIATDDFSNQPIEFVAFRPEQIKDVTNERPTAAPSMFEQEGLPLFDNPLQIEGRVTVRAIAEGMTEAHMQAYGRQLFPEDSPEDYAEVLRVAREELAAQLQQPNSGHGWYSKDVDLAIQQTARILPGLDTKEGRAAFLTFAGIFSNGLDPQQAWQISIEAYEAWQATGEIILNRADAARAVGREPRMTSFKDKAGNKVTQPAGWGPRNAANEQQLQMFKTLIEQQGSVTAALDWLVNPQSRADINQLMADAGVKTPRFKTKAEREGPPTYGALIFSEKLGRYTLGLHGVPVGSEDTTVDLWYTRTYRRWTGRLLEKPIGKEGVAAQPDPARGGIERQTIFSLTGDLMADYPELTAGDVQAMLWFFEKRLWGAQGLRTDEGTNSAGARQALEARGLEFDERGGSLAPGAEGGAAVTLEQPAVEPGGTGSYSGGGLAPLEGAPNVVGASGPDPELVAVAERYAADNGIDLRRQAEFVEVDPERAARIAQAYEEMPHAPQDPAVQAAYADLIQQTLAQYQALVDAGYSFTFFDSETDPYAGNPWNAMRDLRANKTMAVYGTYDGYGTEGLTQAAVDDNPMLQDTGLVWKDQGGVDRPVTANDLFRAVHDAFGHGIEGAGFRARGEENAWQAHVRLFTGPAVSVLTSETRGQNSWLNYGPFGEQNRTASVEDTVFAPQKAGIMPEFTWTEGRAADEAAPTAAAAAAPTLEQPAVTDTSAFREWFGDSKVVDDNGDPLVVYHGTTEDFEAFDPSRLGEATGAASARIGFFFSSSPAVASSYAAAFNAYRDTVLGRVLNRVTGGLYERVNEAILNRFGLSGLEAGGSVMPLYLSIQNPAVYDFGGSEYREQTYADLLSEAKASGHDGMILRNTVDPGFGEGGDVVADVYVAFRPEQIKSVSNVGTFDPNDPRILNQPAEGPQTPERGAVGAPRGSYILPTSDDPRNLIQLTTTADPSTFVHEVGHMFLFQMLRDLQDPRITADGRAQIEAQIAATRAWFESNAEQGLSDLKALAKSIDRRAKANKDDTQLQRRAARLNAAVERANAGGGAAYMQRVAQSFMDPQGAGYDEAAEVVYHELWARGFEKYLGTGSAPSAELRSVFAKFVAYITKTYETLRRLNVTVSPEVADVFDRLLATEDAINAERRGALYQVSPGVLEGATPAEANELRRLAAEAEDEARTQMAARVENSLRAEERAKRRARREEIANEISLQVAAEPTYAAINIAKRGVMPDGKELGTGKISRAEFLAVSDENSLARMPKGMVSGKVAPDNAIPLGDLATLAGFPDIDTMIEALTNPTPPSEADAVKSRTDAQMTQEFGADLDADALQTKAVEVAQNDKFQQLQQLQLRILRRLATQPMQRLAQRQAEQQGAPAPAADTAAAEAARAEQGAARTPREGVQAALARIRADVQRTANASQRRAQAAAGRSTRGIQRNVDPAAVEAAAERFVANLKVKDATPARYRQAASRLTTKIERAIAARNYTEASSLMEQRALNLAVAKRAAAVQSKIEQQRTRWREVTARSDKRLAQRYSIDWINAIRVMLEPFGMARSTPRNYDANKALAALASVEPTLLAEIKLTLATYGGRAQAARQAIPNAPYKDLGVQEALDMLETADTMLANARDSYGILVEGRRVEFAAISDEIAVNVGQRRKVQKQARAEERGRGTRAFRETRRKISGFKASLRRIELWARDIDNGNPRGPMTRYLVRPVMRAVDAYTEARRGPQEALANLLRGRTDIMARKLIKATELDGYVFQSKGELLMALLHTGNPSNKRKLLLGGAEDVESQRKYVWGSLDADGNLDTTRWDRFTARLFAEGTLTKADMDLVQGIWDIFEQTKKPAQAAHKQMYGYYFTEIEAEPLITPVGTYRGGYAPAVTDVMMNSDGNRFEAEEVMSQQSNAAMFPGAEKGFTQSRTEYNKPLDLDLTRIPAHFDRVMKFAYLGPAVRQAARLVTSPAFREAVRPASPDVIDVAVIPWLQRTVQQLVTTPPANQGSSLTSSIAAAIDRRVGLHVMAGNLVNAAQQVTGFSVAAARIPARHIAVAFTQWRVDNQSARAYILSRSTFMQDRLTGGMNEASTTLESILAEPGLLNKAQNAAMRYGYFAQQMAQNLVDPTVWLAAERHGMETVYPAAYAEALERTGDEAAADAAARAEVAEYADSVVRDTQAPLRPSDISGIEASSALARIFLKFYSYFNAMGNLLVTEKNITVNSEIGWAGRYGRSFYAYLLIMYIPTVVAESISQLARGGFDDLDDEDERNQLLFEIFIGSQIKTLAATVPYFGALVSTTYGVAVTEQVYDDRINLSAGIGVTESTVTNVVRLVKAAADPDTDVSTRRAVKTTLDAMGLALGLPINWASKPISYAASVAEGDSDPEGLLDIVQGALTGRDGTER